MRKCRLRVLQQEDQNPGLKTLSFESKSTYKRPLGIKVTDFNLILKTQDLYAVPEVKNRGLPASSLTHLLVLTV